MLKLYSAPGTIALACQIALEEAGAEYELAPVDFTREAQRQPDYLAINPKSRVPALVTDQGVITEAPAILTYIAQAFPAARLAPFVDAFAFAQVQSFCAYLCSWVHPAAAHRYRGARWADDPAAIADMRRKAPENFAAAAQIIEDRYLTGPWVTGDAYTICDPYLFTVAGWLPRDGIEMSRFPKIREHFERMQARPAVSKVLAAAAV